MRPFGHSSFRSLRGAHIDGVSVQLQPGLLLEDAYYQDLPLPDRVFGANSPLISASCTAAALAKFQKGLRGESLVLSTSPSAIALDASDEAFKHLERKGVLRVPQTDEVERLGDISYISHTLIKEERSSVQPGFLMQGPSALNVDALLSSLNTLAHESGNGRVYGIVILTRILNAQESAEDRYRIDALSSIPGVQSSDDMFFYREYTHHEDQEPHEQWRAFVSRPYQNDSLQASPKHLSHESTTGNAPHLISSDQQVAPGAAAQLETSPMSSVETLPVMSIALLPTTPKDVARTINDHTNASAQDDGDESHIPLPAQLPFYKSTQVANTATTLTPGPSASGLSRQSVISTKPPPVRQYTQTVAFPESANASSDSHRDALPHLASVNHQRLVLDSAAPTRRDMPALQPVLSMESLARRSPSSDAPARFGGHPTSMSAFGSTTPTLPAYGAGNAASLNLAPARQADAPMAPLPSRSTALYNAPTQPALSTVPGANMTTPAIFAAPATLSVGTNAVNAGRQSIVPPPVPPLTDEQRQILNLKHNKITGEDVLKLGLTMKNEHIKLHVDQLRVSDGKEKLDLNVYTKRLSNALKARAMAQGRTVEETRHAYNQQRKANGIAVNIGAAKKVADAVNANNGLVPAIGPSPAMGTALQNAAFSQVPTTIPAPAAQPRVSHFTFMAPYQPASARSVPIISPSQNVPTSSLPALMAPPSTPASSTVEVSPVGYPPVTQAGKRKWGDQTDVMLGAGDESGDAYHALKRRRDSGAE